MSSPLDHVVDLSGWLTAAGLDELELNGPGGALRLCRDRNGAVVEDNAGNAEGSGTAAAETIVSPGVGRYLRAHPLREADLTVPGDRIAGGAIVGFLRIGSLLAPVFAPRAGWFVGHVASEGELVGYGDPLADFEPEE